MDEESYLHIDKEVFNASNTIYEELAEQRLMDSDTIILAGYRVQVKVKYFALVCCHGDNKEVKLYKGIHKVRQIVICIDNGYISFDAIRWCIDQDITVIMINWSGCLVQVLTTTHPYNAKLIHQQYVATQFDLCIVIARELIRRKTVSQIEALKDIPVKITDSHTSLLISSVLQILEDGLSELQTLKSIITIRSLEGRLANCYWKILIGRPITWDKATSKIVPPHWLSITDRWSPLSPYHNAKYAINPFHAALNFSYALLEAQCMKSITISGLDTNCGFIHQTDTKDHNDHALTFDLMEPFRPMVDAKLLHFFRTTTFHRGDFYQVLSGECRLNEQLRRYLLASCRIRQKPIDDLVHWLCTMLQSPL